MHTSRLPSTWCLWNVTYPKFLTLVSCSGTSKPSRLIEMLHHQTRQFNPSRLCRVCGKIILAAFPQRYFLDIPSLYIFIRACGSLSSSMYTMNTWSHCVHVDHRYPIHGYTLCQPWGIGNYNRKKMAFCCQQPTIMLRWHSVKAAYVNENRVWNPLVYSRTLPLASCQLYSCHSFRKIRTAVLTWKIACFNSTNVRCYHFNVWYYNILYYGVQIKANNGFLQFFFLGVIPSPSNPLVLNHKPGNTLRLLVEFFIWCSLFVPLVSVQFGLQLNEKTLSPPIALLPNTSKYHAES